MEIRKVPPPLRRHARTCCEHPRLSLKRSPLARKGVDPRDKREGDGLRGGSGGAKAWALATSARDGGQMENCLLHSVVMLALVASIHALL